MIPHSHPHMQHTHTRTHTHTHTHARTAFVVELDNNEGIQSMCLAPLASPSATNGAAETMLVVGTSQGLKYYPTECDGE